jgi:GTP-binding protein EngB required for normal cell division
VLLLIDSRRDFSQQDRDLQKWAAAKQIPVLLVFTKTDKLSPSEKHELMKKYPEAIFYTVMNNGSRHLVEKRIEHILWD